MLLTCSLASRADTTCLLPGIISRFLGKLREKHLLYSLAECGGATCPLLIIVSNELACTFCLVSAVEITDCHFFQHHSHLYIHTESQNMMFLSLLTVSSRSSHHSSNSSVAFVSRSPISDLSFWIFLKIKLKECANSG